jgi:BON domain
MRGTSKVGLLALLLLAACGCQKDDADRLARVARKAATKLQPAGGGDRLTCGLQAVRGSWDELALDARVATRLRWDKVLAAAQIEVQANGGAVELKGKVAGEEQRQRALELARATVGVERVIDTLEVPAPE